MWNTNRLIWYLKSGSLPTTISIKSQAFVFVYVSVSEEEQGDDVYRKYAMLLLISNGIPKRGDPEGKKNYFDSHVRVWIYPYFLYCNMTLRKIWLFGKTDKFIS